MWIGKLDRYIIGKFIGTYVYSIVLIISIAVVFDLTDRIDNFIDKQVPIEAVFFDYYLNFIPYFANLFSALFTFIAVIYFTSRMANQTEIIAILSSGVSFYRLTRPYLISALLIAMLSFSLNAWVIPYANKDRYDFQEKYMDRPYRNYDRNIHRQIEPGVYIYMESYNTSNRIAYKFSIEQFENKKLVSKLLADYARYNEESRLWEVNNYTIRAIEGDKETLFTGQRIDTVINISPVDFNYRNSIVETMTSPELDAFIENQRMHGVTQIESYLIEKHRRWSDPFSTFILTLIGLALASRKVKGGSGLHIGIGLMLSFTYILFMRISSQFAVKGNLDPMLASWLPNILYSLIAAYTYWKAPK